VLAWEEMFVAQRFVRTCTDIAVQGKLFPCCCYIVYVNGVFEWTLLGVREKVVCVAMSSGGENTTDETL
jgi:hypothetical protein